MISYAQNGEDVMLWRALSHIKRGFYVDVGANHPELDSVTKWFYDQGWKGLNLEPKEDMHELLTASRERDLNLRLAAGSKNGTLDFFVSNIMGHSTSNREITKQAGPQETFTKVRANVRKLSTIFDANEVKTVHFLKVDVEGAEKDVFLGLDFSRHRPWVILAEATLPDSTDTNHEEWEPILLDNGYRFVWFDGLNRYYVADEHSDLAEYFHAPPNVFDSFLPAFFVREKEKLAEALRAVDQHKANFVAEFNAAQQREAELAAEINSVRQAAQQHEIDMSSVINGARAALSEKESALLLASEEVARLERRMEELQTGNQRMEERNSEINRLLQMKAEEAQTLKMELEGARHDGERARQDILGWRALCTSLRAQLTGGK